MSTPLSQTELLRLEWLARLRAGEDKQIRGNYEDGKGGVCAIGLADRILAEHGIKSAWVRMGKLHSYFGITLGDEGRIMELNDYQRWSFPMIADYVEKLPIKKWRERKSRLSIEAG
jgi:hypothetical protein